MKKWRQIKGGEEMLDTGYFAGNGIVLILTNTASADLVHIGNFSGPLLGVRINNIPVA